MGYKINLNIFELYSFIEGCARGSHLRQGIWQRLVDEFYGILTPSDRARIHYWCKRDLWDVFHGDPKYPHCGMEDYDFFLGFYDPSNRYFVYAKNDIENIKVEASKIGDHYYVGFNEHIDNSFIQSVEHINNEAGEV